MNGTHGKPDPPDGAAGMNDVRRHRAPRGPVHEALAALGTRLGVGAVLLAAVAVGGVVQAAAPDADTRERPFLRTGSIGEPVDGRTFEVRVLGTRGAKEVSRSGKTRATGGVWVLVRVRVVARAEPTVLSYAAVRDARGRVFVATERISQPLAGGRALQPGIPVEGEIVFEVPQDAAAGLSVRLATTSIDHRLDAMTEIGLGIDSATASAWLAEAEPAVLADEEVASG